MTAPHAAQLALQRDRYPDMSDDQFRWMVQQVAARERAADKLPTFVANEAFWWPCHLSVEQCSSELTALHKASWLRSLNLGPEASLVDLTMGLGVDAYWMSDCFAHTHAVEHDETLCHIGEHNIALWRRPIQLHHTSAEDYLAQLSRTDVVYIDPARRNANGRRVFLINDCTPDVVAMMPAIRQRCRYVMLKLSPMLDITAALKALGGEWDVHVVAVDNEVKELVLLSPGSGLITAVDLSHRHAEQSFTFTRDEETASPKTAIATTAQTYLLEPSAAIMKAAPYRLLANRFHVHPLDPNSHLYTSPTPIPDWQGRSWRIVTSGIRGAQDLINPADGHALSKAHVICRNYPMSTDQVRKHLHLTEGGDQFIIATRLNGKPTIYRAERM